MANVKDVRHKMYSNLKIKKRKGYIEEFSYEKLARSIMNVLNDSVDVSSKVIFSITDRIIHFHLDGYHYNNDPIPSEELSNYVIEELIKLGFKKEADLFLAIKIKNSKENTRNIFKKRIHLKPYEYPEVVEFMDAIRHSYWLHSEFNFTKDIQDYSLMEDRKREVFKRSLLAISQIEVSVKTFWGNIYNFFPKPEFAAVGAVFSESEVRHFDAYSNLLEILNLNHEFEKIYEIPAIIKRVEYLEDELKFINSSNKKDYTRSMLMFSLFIEHVSLFSQFLIIMAYNKYEGTMKGVSNVVEATSKEEETHGNFGVWVVNEIQNEFPEWFGDDFEQEVIDACFDSYEAEAEIIDWIFEKGNLPFLKKEEVKDFIKERFNRSLKNIGINPVFDINPENLKKLDWFDDEIIGTKHTDQFNKRSINYSKRIKSITADDLF